MLWQHGLKFHRPLRYGVCLPRYQLFPPNGHCCELSYVFAIKELPEIIARNRNFHSQVTQQTLEDVFPTLVTKRRWTEVTTKKIKYVYTILRDN